MVASTDPSREGKSRSLATKSRAIGLGVFILSILYLAKPALSQVVRFHNIDKVEVGSSTDDDAAASSPAPSKPKSPPSAALNVDVTDWVVFVADISNPTLNARDFFRSNLPECVGDSRGVPITSDQQKSSEAAVEVSDIVDAQPAIPVAGHPNSAKPADSKLAAPCPVGVIRFKADGPIDKKTKIDVQIGYSGGQTLGHWPHGKPRWAGLLWEDLGLDTEASQEQKLPDGTWLASLRSGSLPIADDKTRESFLLYDVSLRYPTHLVVSSHEPGKYVFSHTMDAPLHDVSLFKRDGDHWLTATLGASAAAAGHSSATAAADPGIAKDKEIPFAMVPTETDKLLKPWQERLTAAGVSESDQAIVLHILARYAFDPNRLTGIYRMDPAELDRVLPLEIVPQPKKISRIALVIVRGLDPALNAELDALIKQMGDPSWKVRDAATKAVRKLGVRAKTRLEGAANSSDTEVAYRAEQVLGSLGNTPAN